MSLFFGRREESRSITSVPWSPFNIGPGLTTSTSQDTALSLSPVFSAIRHITDYGSTLPLKPYRRVGPDRAPMSSLPRLFEDLRVQGRLVPWLSQCIASLVTRGNAVGMVNRRDGFDFPVDITWLDMDRVFVDESKGVPQWLVDGKAVDGPVPGRLVQQLDLVHIPWVTVPGRTLGLSPIEYFAATVQAGLGAQGYGANWFAGGGYPPLIFKNTEKTLKAGAAQTIRERLKESIRRGEPMVTGRDWDMLPVTVPPNQAQFIEVQKLSSNQIAAIYGLEPEEVGGEAANSLTYANEEQRQIKRAANLRPYLVRLEAAFASWLPDLQYVRFNTDAIMRADTFTRWQTYQIRLATGAASVNEIRAIEDDPPIPGGDEYNTSQAAPVQPAAGQQPSNDPANAPTRRLQVIDYGGMP